MNYNILKRKMHCRWCGNEYYARQPKDRDGFDTKACKQALYRALKRYVTTKRRQLLS